MNFTDYKALKAVLDGSISATSENVLIYATSNRRHLMPEFMNENLETRHVGGEIHPGETTEEKISLSERFGLWLSFYPFDQDQYLDIAAHWALFPGGAIFLTVLAVNLVGDGLRDLLRNVAERADRRVDAAARDAVGGHELGEPDRRVTRGLSLPTRVGIRHVDAMLGRVRRWPLSVVVQAHT